MNEDALIRLFSCPETGQPLSLASNDIIQKINERIASGYIVNKGGKKITNGINGGLIRKDNRYLYPIVGNIPILLIPEAIPFESLFTI